MQADFFTTFLPNKFSCNNILQALFGICLRNKIKREKKEADTFQRIIYSIFGEKPSTSSIHSIYDYIDNDSGAKRFILYTQVRNIKKYVSRKKEYKVSWFNFKEISKLKLTEQTKQDIIVGQRVVLLAARSKEEAEIEG